MTPLPHRLRTDWVVVASPGSRVPVDLRMAVTMRSSPSPSGSQAGPQGRLVWSDDRETILVAAWERDRLSVGAAWHREPAGVTLVRGQVRWFAQPWREPGSWSRQLHAELDRTTRGARGPDPIAELTGDFSAVSVGADGHGVLATDQLGMGAIYSGKAMGCEIFGSDARLVAEVAGTGGAGPQADPMAVAWACYLGHIVGPGSGFVGVERLGCGTRVVLGPGRRPELTGREPWLDLNDLRGRSSGDLVETIRRCAIDHVGASLSLVDEPVIELTGGKDSRTVLALAIQSGPIERFRARTVGPPTLPDVEVAAQLASLVQIEHTDGFDLNPPAGTFSERADRYIGHTNGTRSAWHLQDRRAGPGQVRLSGLLGEFLRVGPEEGSWADGPGPDLAPGSQPEAMVAHLTRSGSGGRSRLLRPAVVEGLEAALRTDLLDDPVAQVSPRDLLASFYLRTRREIFGGPVLDLDNNHRIWVLVHHESVRAAMALETPVRQSDQVHRELIGSAAPELLAHPLVGGGRWRGGRPPLWPAARRPSARPAAGSATPAPGRPVAPSLMAVILSEPDAERTAFLDESFSDPANPVWELADRRRTLTALSDLDRVPIGIRRELYAIATGARWLAAN